MEMTNRWNRAVYRAWAPIYDIAVGRLFANGRRRAMELVALRPGEKVLLLGVGTGADLPLLPRDVEATGVDLSEHMLAKARAKLDACRANVTLVLGDAQAPPVADQSFDAAILNLILSVVPDARACMRCALRALKPAARLVIFDKFQPDAEAVPLARRTMNVASSALGTDITRRLGDILEGTGCEIVTDEPNLFGGMYRVILLRKP
jgi:phosphatidylethanolamine/phosphatidyl-N-methylethanolamine N-methyltransferase